MVASGEPWRIVCYAMIGSRAESAAFAVEWRRVQHLIELNSDAPQRELSKVRGGINVLPEIDVIIAQFLMALLLLSPPFGIRLPDLDYSPFRQPVTVPLYARFCGDRRCNNI